MADEINREFGQRLVKVRKSLNIIQKDLAAAVGMHACNLSAVESGKSSPTARLLHKLSTTFDISLDFLFRGTGEMFLTDKIKKAKDKANAVENIDSLEDMIWVALHSNMFKNTILGHAATYYYVNRESIKLDIKQKSKKEAKEKKMRRKS